MFEYSMRKSHSFSPSVNGKQILPLVSFPGKVSHEF